MTIADRKPAADSATPEATWPKDLRGRLALLLADFPQMEVLLPQVFPGWPKLDGLEIVPDLNLETSHRHYFFMVDKTKNRTLALLSDLILPPRGQGKHKGSLRLAWFDWEGSSLMKRLLGLSYSGDSSDPNPPLALSSIWVGVNSQERKLSRSKEIRRLPQVETDPRADFYLVPLGSYLVNMPNYCLRINGTPGDHDRQPALFLPQALRPSAVTRFDSKTENFIVTSRGPLFAAKPFSLEVPSVLGKPVKS